MSLITEADAFRESVADLVRQYQSGSLSAKRAMQAVASISAEAGKASNPDLECSEARVYRIDVGGRGWRATFDLQGARYSRYFADDKYGSAKLSKEEALRFAAQFDEYKELRSLANRFKARKNSRSGVPGVARYEPNNGRGAFWLGYWTDPASGKKRSKRFPVTIHGESLAKDLAIEFRESSMKSLMAKYDDMLDSLSKSDLKPISPKK